MNSLPPGALSMSVDMNDAVFKMEEDEDEDEDEDFDMEEVS